MANIASSQQSFLINGLQVSTHNKPKFRNLSSSTILISCGASSSSISSNNNKNNNHHHDSSSKNEMKLAKLAVITLAAGVLTLGSFNDDALAAKSGGRVGGQAFRSAPRSSSPRPSSPRINNSRTNIYINPQVAPPLLGGYGYGGYGYGGWGWSPFSFFAPGPSVAVGVGGGFELVPFFLFLGVAAAVVRRFTGSRDEDDD